MVKNRYSGACNICMHTLHVTEAFVVGSYEHGETSRVYKVFTQEKGLLYAHAQGVREYKNKNRYELRNRI